MKVFISMPMKGKTEEQIREEMEQIKKDFGYSDSEFIDSIIPGHENMTRLECLAESIKLLDKADGAFFAKGWEDAAGCRIERAVCHNYGIEVYE